MIIVNKSDFKGKWLVAHNKFSDLDSYIERYEKTILNELMGHTLFTDFETDPADTKWDELKDIGFGLLSLTVGLIYFEYVRDLPYRNTNQGVAYQLDENANQVITVLALRQRYNECITDWKQMQCYLGGAFADFKGAKNRKFMID